MSDVMVASDELALSIELQWNRWIRKYQWHLGQVPGLLEAMREDVLRISSDAARYGAERVDSSREGAPVPFRVEVVDAIDELWAALVEYSVEVSRVLEVPLPDVGSWRVGSSTAGVRASADPRRDAFALTAWLLERVEDIAARHELGDAEDRLFPLIRSSAKRFLTPVPVRGRKCKACGALRVLARWTREGEIAECDECGHRVSLAVTRPLSTSCADGDHAACSSPECTCACHVRRSSLWTARREVPGGYERPMVEPMSSSCDHATWTRWKDPEGLWRCGGCGVVRDGR